MSRISFVKLADGAEDLRQDAVDPGALEKWPGPARLHVLVQFLEETRPGAGGKTVAVAENGRRGPLLDDEVEAGGVAQDAPDADRVLRVARIRVADDADPAGLEVLEAADVIDDGIRGDVIE